MTDAETTAAIEALTHRLRNNRDEDPEVFALEFITALRGRGWRHVSVLTGPPPAAAGPVAPLKPETAGLLEDLHAEMEAKAAAARAAKLRGDAA